MKEGLFLENQELIYYKNGKPYHAGVIRVDGDYYYISSGGRAVKGTHIVHREMANGLLKRGTYRFGEDYKLIKNSYIPPKSRSKKQKWLWLLKNKKNQKLMAACVLCVLAMILIGTMLGHKVSVVDPEGTTARSDAKIQLPVFEEDVLLCSSSAKMEYDGEITLKQAVEYGDPYRPFVFEYQFANVSGTLLLGQQQDLSDGREYPMPAESDHVAIDNLLVDTTYYYKVLVNGEEYSGNFHTAPSTRFVSIPGLKNTRDIGGRTNLDGKRVRQGVLIRGVELDGLVNASYYIPEEELEAVRENFGFVYDLDLRAPSIYFAPDQYQSRLGIPHKFYTAPQYGEIFTNTYKASLRQIFSDLADPEKYPMYLHCTWGRDRTGTVVFLLQGVLNMSEEDMVREYRLTSYVDKGMAESRNMEMIIGNMQQFEGNTLNEKIVTFLTTIIGVTEEEIDSIRSIYLES